MNLQYYRLNEHLTNQVKTVSSPNVLIIFIYRNKNNRSTGRRRKQKSY